MQQHIAPKDWQLLKEKRLVDGDEETLNLILKSPHELESSKDRRVLEDESCEELGSNRGNPDSSHWEVFKASDTSSSDSGDSSSDPINFSKI